MKSLQPTVGWRSFFGSWTEVPRARNDIDREFELDSNDGRSESRHLCDILLDERPAPAPNSEGIMPPVVTTRVEMWGHETTEEEWGNM
jgi:hypothetical protein